MARRNRCRSGLIVLTMFACGGVTSSPAQVPVKNVLVIETGAPGRPVANALTEALDTALAEVSTRVSLTVFFEWLDLDRFRGEEYEVALQAYLADKYRRYPPDVLVALGDASTRLVLTWRQQLWPQIPLVFVSNSDDVERAARQASGTAGIAGSLEESIAGSLDAVLTLLPETNEIVLVSAGDVNLPLAERALRRLPAGVRVTRLVDLSFDEILRGVSRLSERSVIFYSSITRDRDGRAYIARTALDELARHANRPIFSYVGTFLGHGIVGGLLVQPHETMRELAPIIERVATGTPPGDLPVSRRAPPRLSVDARQLARWGIDESRLPRGSEVLFRDPSLWRDYRGTVIATVSLVGAQAVLIGALLLQMRRRRAAERQARHLSGRVLTAQEEERRRIASELHDGANQEVALFAMQLDQAGMGALADRARTLSRDLHRLSHELHPAILDQVGLVPAIRQFASQLGTLHRLRVEVRESRWPAAVPRAVVITLYRVAQEAVQNVVRHSGATDATVDLEGTPSGLTMMIADRGVGFDPALRPEGHLGLAGMQERMRGIGGRLEVTSIPGRGTRILATVPAEAVAAMEMDERLAEPGNRRPTGHPA